MPRPRDEMLGRLTDSLGDQMWTGTFVGNDTGVAFVVRHQRMAEMSWDELESAEDPVALARERLGSVLNG